MSYLSFSLQLCYLLLPLLQVSLNQTTKPSFLLESSLQASNSLTWRFRAAIILITVLVRWRWRSNWELVTKSEGWLRRWWLRRSIHGGHVGLIIQFNWQIVGFILQWWTARLNSICDRKNPLRIKQNLYLCGSLRGLMSRGSVLNCVCPLYKRFVPLRKAWVLSGHLVSGAQIYTLSIKFIRLSIGHASDYEIYGMFDETKAEVWRTNDQVSVHQVILWKMDTLDKKLRARCWLDLT